MKSAKIKITGLLICLIAVGNSTAQSQTGSSPLAQQSQQEFIKQKTQQNRAAFEISAWTGYMFGGKFDQYNYLYDIEDAQDFGAALSLEVRPNYWVEFTYNFMATEAKERYLGVTEVEGINVNYFQLGTQKVLDVHEKVKPFGLLSLGASYFNREKRDDIWAFSAIAGGGLKIYLTDRLGLRLQGRFMIPMYFSGLGFGVGTGGVSGGATFGAYALQGDFSGGIVLRM